MIRWELCYSHWAFSDDRRPCLSFSLPPCEQLSNRLSSPSRIPLKGSNRWNSSFLRMIRYQYSPANYWYSSPSLWRRLMISSELPQGPAQSVWIPYYLSITSTHESHCPLQPISIRFYSTCTVFEYPFPLIFIWSIYLHLWILLYRRHSCIAGIRKIVHLILKYGNRVYELEMKTKMSSFSIIHIRDILWNFLSSMAQIKGS